MEEERTIRDELLDGATVAALLFIMASWTGSAAALAMEHQKAAYFLFGTGFIVFVSFVGVFTTQTNSKPSGYPKSKE